MKNASQANFVLIDGVLRPGAIANLYQRGEPLAIEPLYIKTRWKELHDLGPILVSLRGRSNLVSDTYRSTTQQAAASLLHSRAPIKIVADHLRRFIAPSDVRGGSSLLRFADPLVARYWLGSHHGVHLDAVLGPIEAWHVPNHPHTWELAHPPQWQSFVRAAPPPDWLDTYARLGEIQLSALHEAARWRFMERLHHSFERRHAQHLARIDKSRLTQWFDERLDEAQAWGLASERSLAVWVEYSLRWGDGFTLRANEPYQRWLAGSPEALKLAPELRIQQMDNACYHTDMNKDV